MVRNIHIPVGAPHPRPGPPSRLLSGATLGACAALAILHAAATLAGASPIGRPSRPELLACASSQIEPSAEAFPATALSAPTGAERGTGPAATALAKFLAETNTGRRLPAHGYQLLTDDGSVAVFGRGPYGPTGSYVTVSRSKGAWSVTTAGGCWPHVVRRDRLVASFNALAARPYATTRALRLLVEPPACRSAPALAGAELVWRPHRLTVTLLLANTQAAGRGTVWTMPTVGTAPNVCAEAGRLVEYRIQLPRPLGARTVYDGSRLPTAAVRHYGR